MKIIAIFLSAFCAAALGIPLGDHVQHETRSAQPLLRRSTAQVDGSAVFPARIALKQRNLERGMQLLLGVSDPASPSYGRHYTPDEVAELFAPDDAAVGTVTRWLRDAGIDRVSVPRSRGFVDFATTADELGSLLRTKYHIYDHAATGAQQLGADAYHLPRAVSEVVDFVAPGIVTGGVARRQAAGAGAEPLRRSRFKPLGGGLATTAAAGCDTLVTPKCIADKYKIPPATLNATGNRLGIYENNDEMYRQSDLDAFYKAYAPAIPAGTGPVVDLIDWSGGARPDPGRAVGEAALDLDMAIPIVHPQRTEVFQSRDNFGAQTRGFLNVFLDAVDGAYCNSTAYGQTGDDPKVDGTTKDQMCGAFAPTNVISFSYGLTEAAWPVNYQKRQCDEFMKLGLQGVTVVFASGDGGVAGAHGGDCGGADGELFNPAAPASCPYVTSVGATTIPEGRSVDDAEVAVASFASGGGFSTIWERPSYQDAAVSSWLQHHDPGFPGYAGKDGALPGNGTTDGGVYNKAGRGFPDVAALGDKGAVVFNGRPGTSGGTSMAAPIFAAVVGRINEERVAAGRRPLGFVNPALYANPAMFNDVTAGDQKGGAGNCKDRGFSAAAGWDPVTGLGTPKYPEMLAYLKDL